MGCTKAGGRLNSAWGYSLPNPDLYPETWFSPPVLHPVQNRPKHRVQVHSEKETWKVQIKELRKNNLVADSAIIPFSLGLHYWGYAMATEVTVWAKPSLFHQTTALVPSGYIIVFPLPNLLIILCPCVGSRYECVCVYTTESVPGTINMWCLPDIQEECQLCNGLQTTGKSWKHKLYHKL